MKTYLIIGAGPGISLETARKFAGEGYRVVLAARNLARTRELASSIPGAEARQVDAADPHAVVALVAKVEAEYGAIDVLHYNAAVIRNAKVQSQAPDSFNSDLAINIGGALAAIHAAAPAMLGRGSGTVLLTGGGLALAPRPDYLSLSIGKAGIRVLALGLFEEFRAGGVHVATVTVMGYVKAGSEDTRRIAEAFWALSSQAQTHWTAETTYEPIGA